MNDKNAARKTNPPERRRFLRESLTGSVPLFFSWLGGRAVELARMIQPPASRQTSPPPAAADSAPAEAKQELEKHYEDFARDNPSASDYPSSPSSSPTETARGETTSPVPGNEPGS